MKKCYHKFFRNGYLPLYPGLRRVVCNGGVQPGLAVTLTLKLSDTDHGGSASISDVWYVHFLF